MQTAALVVDGVVVVLRGRVVVVVVVAARDEAPAVPLHQTSRPPLAVPPLDLRGRRGRDAHRARAFAAAARRERRRHFPRARESRSRRGDLLTPRACSCERARRDESQMFSSPYLLL